MKIFLFCLVTAASLCLLAVASLSFSTLFAGGKQRDETFDTNFSRARFELKKHHIVASGSVRGSQNLEFFIDTGANCSLVDRNLVERLQLKPKGPWHEITVFGRVVKARRAVLPDLRLGPIGGDLPCFVVSLPEGWDVLIGMDRLRLQSFTIDYEESVLVFGRRKHLPSIAPFERNSSHVVVSMELGKRSLRLVVDTGTPDIVILPTPKLACWIGENLPSVGVWCMRDLTGCTLAPIVALPRARVGNWEWKGLKAGVRENPLPFADGYLGVFSLALKQIYFDFEDHLISWKK